MTGFELASIIAASIALVVSAMALHYTSRQTQYAAYQAFSARLFAVNDIFIEYPALRPFFYDGVVPPSDDAELHGRALGVAENLLDLFDCILMQEGTIRHLWKRDWWTPYIIASFEDSPVLRERLASAPRSWYSERLQSMAAQAEASERPS